MANKKEEIKMAFKLNLPGMWEKELAEGEIG